MKHTQEEYLAFLGSTQWELCTESFDAPCDKCLICSLVLANRDVLEMKPTKITAFQSNSMQYRIVDENNLLAKLQAKVTDRLDEVME